MTRNHGVHKGENTVITAGPDSEKALHNLKEALQKYVCLRYPNFSKPFIVTSDGSLKGIGGYLSQLDAKGCQRPLAFASRTLRGAEKHYAPVELECLAVIYALKQFRHIILGYDVVVQTDHKPLIFLMKHPDPTSRLYRYQLTMMEYNIKNLEYIQGSSNQPHRRLFKSVQLSSR